MPPKGSGPLDQKGQLLMPTMVCRRMESPGVLMRVVPRFIGFLRTALPALPSAANTMVNRSKLS